MRIHRKPTVMTATLLLGLTALAGCAPAENSSSTDISASASSTSNNNSDQALSISQPWVKASQSDMTATFAEITNQSEEAVKIVKAESSVSDMVQLHTTVLDPKTGSSSMKQVDSFTIEPGETFKLEPGGNHIMLMNMKCSIPAGHRLTITLTDDQGKTYDLDSTARDYSAAKEEYAPGEQASHSGHENMKMDHSAHSSDATAAAQQSVKDECAQ